MFSPMIPSASATGYPTLRFFALSLGLIALTACNIPATQRGNLPKPDALEQVKPGITDKQTVTRLLGTPSSTAAFDGNIWYYISHETKQVAFLKPELLDQQVVAVRFDDNGVVVGIDRKGLPDAQTITPNPDATPAQGREYTFLEQLIGNFGKFNSAKDNSTPGGPKSGRDGS